MKAVLKAKLEYDPNWIDVLLVVLLGVRADVELDAEVPPIAWRTVERTGRACVECWVTLNEREDPMDGSCQDRTVVRPVLMCGAGQRY